LAYEIEKYIFAFAAKDGKVAQVTTLAAATKRMNIAIVWIRRGYMEYTR